MTDCKELPGEQFLLDYLSGELPESETVRFEEHYFAVPAALRA